MANRIGNIDFKIINPVGKVQIVMLKGEKGDTYDDTELRNRIRTQDGIIANFIEESTEQIDDLTELVGTFDDRITDNKTRLDNIIDIIYPIGSIYTSTRNVSPASFIGGTWTQIKDTFLLTAGDTYQAGTTGGEATHTLTTSEMPSHAHGLNNHTHTFSHTHGVPEQTITTSQNGNHTHSSKGSYVYHTTSEIVGADYFANSASAADTRAKWNDLSQLMYEAGNHQHTATVQATTTNSQSTSTTGGANGNTSSNGSSNAHNNMPPYRVVYAWERTA